MESKEYCPRCRTLVLVQLTESRQRRTCPNGTAREVLVRTFHCASCRCFLRSEDVPLPKSEEQTPHA